MYIDTQNMSDEEKSKLKRRLQMEQMSYTSDLKKINRDQMEQKEELRRLEQDKARIDVYVKENKERTRALQEKEDFINEELRNIKKQLINLG